MWFEKEWSPGPYFVRTRTRNGRTTVEEEVWIRIYRRGVVPKVKVGRLHINDRYGERIRLYVLGDESQN